MLLPRKVGLWRGTPREVPHGGSPQLSVWTQGHWLTLEPYVHSSDLHVIPAILGGGHQDSHFRAEQWWSRALLGSESQTEWGQTEAPDPSPGPFFLVPEMD